MLQTMTLTKEQVLEILNRIKKVKICVVGDVCLDIYWHADMKRSRLSKETPHYPLPVIKETYSPGGCGNVMNNVYALQVEQLIPVSAIGDDWRGYLLKKCFGEIGIPTEQLLNRSSGITPTYCKPMRMGISDTVYEDPRLDFENFEALSAQDEEKLATALEEAAKTVDIIAVADQFTKGVITPRIRKLLSEIALRVPVVVDSREHAVEYTGVIVKPNELEAAQALSMDLTDQNPGVAEYMDIAKKLQQKNQSPVAVTIGSLGAIWCDGTKCVLAPTVKAEPPVDIVGAGDTFLSAFCCALAACKDGAKALAFANLASGVTVKKIGTTGTASPEEILAKWEEYYGEKA